MENIHSLAIGKSGSGKSTNAETQFLQNLAPNRAAVFIDPHGPSIDAILDHLPRQYANRTCVIDIGGDNVVGFNPITEPHHFITTFESQWRDSLGARAINRLYFALAAVHEAETSFLDVQKMFTDDKRRDEILEKIKDPATREFWLEEYASATAKFNADANEAVLNKISRFTAFPHIRSALQVRKPRFNYADVLKHHYIVLINLNKPKAGSSTASLYGGMHLNALYTQIKQTPYPCDLYIDEFHSIGSDIIAEIMPESRKFNLALHLMLQFLSQIKDETVCDAIVSNVAAITAFQLTPRDSRLLAPHFNTNVQNFERELTDLPPFKAWKHTKAGNEIITTRPLPPRYSHKATIVHKSNERFATPIVSPAVSPSKARYRSRYARP